MNTTFIVVLKDQGRYVLSTRRQFPTRELAQAYADTCAQSREPLVVEGRFPQLEPIHVNWAPREGGWVKIKNTF